MRISMYYSQVISTIWWAWQSVSRGQVVGQVVAVVGLWQTPVGDFPIGHDLPQHHSIRPPVGKGRGGGGREDNELYMRVMLNCVQAQWRECCEGDAELCAGPKEGGGHPSHSIHVCSTHVCIIRLPLMYLIIFDK